ncbi:MAG: DUF2116 family Zn-ribbon domain-containing protein [Methanomassiliicoccales archaeon]
MNDRIPPHSHCRECGKAVAENTLYCSPKCEAAHKEKLRRRRNQLYTYYALLLVFLILALIALGLR